MSQLPEGMRDPTTEWILIEGPGGDAEFYGRWLLRAAEATRLWQQALATDWEFGEQAADLEFNVLSIGYYAVCLVSRLAGEPTLAISVTEDWVETFVIMTHLRFFVLTGERYQMVLPGHFDFNSLNAAYRKLLETQDENDFIHHEHLLQTMPLAAAQQWQRRLNKMDESERIADREALLFCD